MVSNIVETQQTRFFHDKVIHALTSQTLENRAKTSKIFKKIINFRHQEKTANVTFRKPDSVFTYLCTKRFNVKKIFLNREDEIIIIGSFLITKSA